jgi:hypothetical protein
MSISSLSGITSGASQYDFTKLTNKQAISAAGDLANEGKITEDEFATLAGEALSFSPSGSIQAGSGTDPLSSTTTHDFVSQLQDNIAELKQVAGSDAAEQKSLTIEKSLLQKLTQYQSQYGTSVVTQNSGVLLNQLA